MACPHGAPIGDNCAICSRTSMTPCAACGQPIGAQITWVGDQGPFHTTCAPEGVPRLVGWMCPKCSNVYGPHVDTCIACNRQAEGSRP